MTSATKHCTHWIGGKPWTGSAVRAGDIYNPATGQISGSVDYAGAAEVDAAVAAAAAAFPSWRETSLVKRASVMFAFRELLRTHTAELAELITAEHGKVASDAAGEVARGLEVVEFACGMPHLLKGGVFREGLDRRRRLLDPPAARRGRRHHAVQLPGHGADVDVRRSRSPRATRSCSSRRRRTRRPSLLHRRAAGRGRAARRRLQRRARRQGGGRLAADPSATSGPSASSARPRSPGTSTRPARRRASGCRRSAARRTTWSCCPTPTSTWPPTPPSRPAYGSAGERCMAISVLVAVGAVGDELIDAIAARLAEAEGRPRRRPDSDMGPLVTGAHRDKVAGLHRRRRAAGATLAVDGRSTR